MFFVFCFAYGYSVFLSAFFPVIFPFISYFILLMSNVNVNIDENPALINLLISSDNSNTLLDLWYVDVNVFNTHAQVTQVPTTSCSRRLRGMAIVTHLN